MVIGYLVWVSDAVRGGHRLSSVGSVLRPNRGGPAKQFLEKKACCPPGDQFSNRSWYSSSTNSKSSSVNELKRNEHGKSSEKITQNAGNELKKHSRIRYTPPPRLQIGKKISAKSIQKTQKSALSCAVEMYVC